MTARATVREYYEALRHGEPLDPFFAAGSDVVKIGIGERLVGGDAVAEGLRDQTRATTDWRVESHDLRTTARDDCAAVADVVDLAWTDVAAERRFDFHTRWSGTLFRDGEEEPAWSFVGMHVSAPHETGGD